MANVPTLSSADSPVGVYIVKERFAPLESELYTEAVHEISRGAKNIARPWGHMSVYTRGWFFDITSSLADDTAAYIAHSGAQPRVIFRARRVPEVYKESMQRYTAYRIGATTQPLWMMYEIGRRMASVMGYYTYLSKNCNLFATAFAHCLLHPGTLASIRDHGPVFIANDLVTLAEEDTLYAERLRRGEKRKVWAKNLGLDVIIRVCFIRYIEGHKRFGRSRLVRSLTPPQRSPWDSREYWWQDEIRAVRIFVILNVHRQDADSAEIVLTVASTMSLPTTHTLYVPNAENSRPDETITSTPGLELGRDEMLLLLIPEPVVPHLHLDQEPSTSTLVATPQCGRAYVLAHSDLISSMSPQGSTSFVLSAGPNLNRKLSKE